MRIEFTELPFYTEFVELAGPERRIQMVRDYCNAQLRATLWTTMEYAPTNKEAWAAYRSAMQVFSETYDPENTNPIFPAEPQIVLVSDIVSNQEIAASTEEE